MTVLPKPPFVLLIAHALFSPWIAGVSKATAVSQHGSNNPKHLHKKGKNDNRRVLKLCYKCYLLITHTFSIVKIVIITTRQQVLLYPKQKMHVDTTLSEQDLEIFPYSKVGGL